eukprot:scaffold6051_cov28-Prasinocladus_malaysianus.AAC.3
MPLINEVLIANNYGCNSFFKRHGGKASYARLVAKCNGLMSAWIQKYVDVGSVALSQQAQTTSAICREAYLSIAQLHEVV